MNQKVETTTRATYFWKGGVASKILLLEFFDFKIFKPAVPVLSGFYQLSIYERE